MKKMLLIFVAALFIKQSAFCQNVFFAKENYTDSVLLQKNIAALAEQVIAKYKDEDEAKYYDNLFRLQLLANQYNAVEPTLIKLAFIKFRDTITTKAFSFPYKIYNATMSASPAAANFVSQYQTIFTTIYKTLSEDGKNWVAEYFDNDVPGLRQKLAVALESVKNKDSLTISDALQFCRSWLSAQVYSTTQKLAKDMLMAFDNAKYIKEDSVIIKMPDGGEISLTIVRNRNIAAPQPVILKYSIYPSADNTGICKEAASRGYVGVVADTRGKRLSSSSIEPHEHDARDAYYIIDWISKQSWCNGKVGMYGGSYVGFTQWAAAKHLHPALKTIVPQVPVAAGVDYPKHNGIFMTFMLRWLHYVTNNKLLDNAEFADTAKWNKLFASWYKNGTSFRSLDSLEGKPNAIFQRWLQHPAYDAYWQNMTPQKEEFAKINIPIFTTTGYWDDEQVGALYYWHQYHKWNKEDNFYLLIGPYDHGGAQGYPARKLTNYTIDSVANIPILDIVFQWFDYTLKDSSRPAILKDKINFEIMGSNIWKHVPTLSKMSNDTLNFYFGSTLKNNQYHLTKTKPSDIKFIHQQVDFKDRTQIHFLSEEVSAFPNIIDSALSPQKEKLVFVSDPLKESFAISGALKASIVASINKKDMDIVLDLYEQTPDGNYIALTENLQRASFAKDDTKRQLLQPGKIETIEMNSTYITCKQLHKGSKIIIVIGVNKNPIWQINYGTGKDVSDETMKDAQIPLQIKWYTSSLITIPILK